MNKIDYLKEDEPICGQKYVCISFISPEGLRNTTVRGVKIRGSYDTYEEAQTRAKQLQELDPTFNIFIGEVGKWLPWDPSPDDKSKVKDSMYAEEELQTIVKEYEKNREKAKILEQERRDEMRRAAIESSESSENSSSKGSAPKKKPLGKRLKQKKKEIDEKFRNIESEKQIKTQIKESSTQLHNKEKEIEEIDGNLDKLRQLYEKMQKDKKNTQSQ